MWDRGQWVPACGQWRSNPSAFRGRPCESLLLEGVVSVPVAVRRRANLEGGHRLQRPSSARTSPSPSFRPAATGHQRPARRPRGGVRFPPPARCPDAARHGASAPRDGVSGGGRGARRRVPSGQVWILSGSPGSCQGRVPGGAGEPEHTGRGRGRGRERGRRCARRAGAGRAGSGRGTHTPAGRRSHFRPRAPGAGTAARAASASRVGRRGVRGVAAAQPSSRRPGPAARSVSLPARRAASFPAMAHQERTFIAIKPDGVQRGLVGDIVKRFEQKGFRLVAMKFLRASEDLLKQHYIDLKDRPFYPGLVKYMHSGPVVAMVWEGLNVVKTGRMMLGETNPADSKPGTIRGDFCIQVGRNIIHGSDSVKSAEKEISLWFKPEELVDYKSCAFDWIYE